MKKQIVLIISLLLALNSNAFAVADTMNPKLSITIGDNNFTAKLAKEVKNDLVQSNWLETIAVNNVNDGLERIYKFNEIGRLEIITSFEDGHSEQKNMVWRISTAGNNVILTLTDLGSDAATTYIVKQTEAGLTLTDQLLQKKLNWIFQ